MDCVQFEEIVHDLDRPGTRWRALRERALAHAESCAHCAQLMTETESLDQALRAMCDDRKASRSLRRAEAALLRRISPMRRPPQARHRVSCELRRSASRRQSLLAAGVLAVPCSAGRETPPQDQVSPSRMFRLRRGGSARIRQPDATPTRFGYRAPSSPLPYADDPDGAGRRRRGARGLSGPALASLGMPVAWRVDGHVCGGSDGERRRNAAGDSPGSQDERGPGINLKQREIGSERETSMNECDATTKYRIRRRAAGTGGGLRRARRNPTPRPRLPRRVVTSSSCVWAAARWGRTTRSGSWVSRRASAARP